jgi:hypothetical protein
MVLEVEMASAIATMDSIATKEDCVALLAANPIDRRAMQRLGDFLASEGRSAEACAVVARAVDAYPDDPVSLVSLARLLIEAKDLEGARGHLLHALAIDPRCRAAHAGLSFVLADLGEAAQAKIHRRIAFQGRCVILGRYRGQRAPVTVLKLISTSGGNLRTEGLLSDCVFQTHLVATEFYDTTTVLPPHRLIVNAIGDPDVAGAALDGARALLNRTTAPAINLPATVATTSRLAIARRLAGLRGVVTPKIARLARESLAAVDAPRMLIGEGFRFPVLLRTPGFHGGEHFLKVENPDRLAAAVAELPGRDLYVIEFLDARSRDGKIRKYRVMMIDGELYPLHAAIAAPKTADRASGGQWKIHYFSAEMEDRPEHRAEDAAFLSNMPSVLGRRATNALRAIQKTLGLDYGGIDFGLSEAGDVLVFEANATMAIFPSGEDPRWDYRRPAVERVLGAVRRMLIDRASAERNDSRGEIPRSKSLARVAIDKIEKLVVHRVG